MSFKETEVGRIPIDWDVKMIQEIGEVVSGGTPKTKELSYWDGDISWITPKDLSNFNERYIEKGERSITKEGLDNSSTKLIPKNSVLFSSRAPIGYVALAKKDLCTNQGFKNIVCDSNISYYDFIYYMMKYKKNDLESIAGGSTFKEVSGKTVKEFKIPLPQLEEQKAIAKILSDLDSKIEVNNKINKNLEEMAQAIFKQWFIDFEFPNEEGNPYKSSGGEMVESEFGMIPKEWCLREFGDIVDILDSKRIPLSKKQRDKMDKIYPYYGAASLMDYVEDYIFDGIYVLMGEDGTVIDSNGYPILQYVWGKFWVNNHAHVLKGKGEISEEFIYLLLKNQNVTSIVTGAVQPKINQQNMRGIKLVLPEDEKLMIQFSEIVRSIFANIRNNEEQNRHLSKLRDTLLPKLMSGEIRVNID